MKTVLVLDDDPDFRALYRRALERVGRRIVEAETSDEAAHLIDTAAPDAIVMDVELGDGTSSESLLTRLGNALTSPPVVICSSSKRAARIARRFGVRYLPKSSLLHLAAAVDEATASDGPDGRPRPRAATEEQARDSRVSLF